MYELGGGGVGTEDDFLRENKPKKCHRSSISPLKCKVSCGPKYDSMSMGQIASHI